MSESTTESETVTEITTVDDDQNVPAEPMKLAIRQVLERQIGAGQALSSQLVDAATDVTTAIAHAPATFAGAIHNLP